MSHNMSNTKEYRAWSRMRNLCRNKKMTSYRSYGGRGIAMDKEWDDFMKFYTDMGPMPNDCDGIELINMDADFSKHNCRYVGRATRRSLKEMPGNQNRLSRKKIKEARGICISLPYKMLTRLKQIAFSRTMKDDVKCSVGDLIRETLEEKYPTETRNMF